MGQVSAREGGAVGLTPCADAVAVRLAFGPVDWLWRVVRFVLAVAGAVVVLSVARRGIPRGSAGAVL